ncbi:hypothetical protein JHK85_056804 [Glycine max]|nr:hypothetical protein JHK85_056804 [Glycine max]
MDIHDCSMVSNDCPLKPGVPTKARRDDGDQRDARMRCVTHLVCELHMRGPCVGLHAVVF